MKNSGNASESENLRQKAEAALKHNPLPAGLPLSENEMVKLIHELEVHQIELELQHAELDGAKSALQAEAEKYSELYDFSPVGLFSLSGDGIIRNLNLTGSRMLGKERSHLINSSFAFFLSDNVNPVFRTFLNRVFNNKTRETCDLTLPVNDNFPVFVHLAGIATENGKQCFLSMLDISARILAEEALLVSEKKYRNLVENALIGIYSITLDGNFEFVNQAMCTLLEFESVKELMCTEVQSIYRNNTDRAELIEQIKKFGQIFNAEFKSQMQLLD